MSFGKGKRSKISPSKYSNYVEHPRYGRGPRITGLHVEPSYDPAAGPLVFLHWLAGQIPNTAIPSDVSKQRPATVQVTHYLDAERICRRCNQPFIFFAEEQKFWYEELKFPLEADARECFKCRREIRDLQKLKERYGIDE